MNQLDYSLCNNNLFKKEPLVTLGERRFYLNNSKSKFVSVGLSYTCGFIPCIKISGNKGDSVEFDEKEWEHFLTYQGIICNYLYTNEGLEPVDAEKFTLEFKRLPYATVVKITKDNSSVYLTYDTVCTLWHLLPLINYRIQMLKNQHFFSYFKVLQKGLQNMSGDVLNNAVNLISFKENPNSENISMVMEFLYLHPEAFKQECQERKYRLEKIKYISCVCGTLLIEQQERNIGNLWLLTDVVSSKELRN